MHHPLCENSAKWCRSSLNMSAELSMNEVADILQNF